MITSGTTAKATTDATATDVIALAAIPQPLTSVQIVNEGPAGFFSLDGGGTLIRLPAASAVTLERIPGGFRSVKIKRDGAVNMTGVYAAAWAAS